MKRYSFLLTTLLAVVLLTGADGCSSDPNVEGAKLDLRNKDYTRALENLDTALQTNPANAEAHTLKARVFQEMTANPMDDLDAHVETIAKLAESAEAAMSNDPLTAEVVEQYISMAYVNEFNHGIRAFNRGQEEAAEYEVAAAHFYNAALLRPDSVGTYVNAAFALINGGNTEKAITAFEDAVSRGESSADTYVYLADLYRQKEEFDKVIDLLKPVIETYPANADVQAQLLNAYLATEQTDEALAQYQSAVDNEPENKLYRYNYGSLLLQLERYDAAIDQLRVATELDETYGNAWYNLGATFVNKAVAVNDEIIALDDEIREQGLTGDNRASKEAEIEALVETRRGLYEEAVTPLERARVLLEESGEDASGVCTALFQAYVQTNQMEKGEEAQACAGMN